MSNQWNNLLMKELGSVGSSKVKHIEGTAPTPGGSLGAILEAHFLPTRQSRQKVRVPRDPNTVLTQVSSFLDKQGQVANDRKNDTFQSPQISGVMGSGFFKMNPTLVQIEIIDSSRDACRLLVSGAAKEGLIEQRSAEKAVNRVVDFLKTIS